MTTMTHTLTYQGHRIQYELHGQGPLLCFLHGWPTNARLWDHQVQAFQATHRVLTLDWLGFGQSDAPRDHTYTFTTQQAVLEAVLQTVLPAEEQVTLIAHDIGGPAAILWASQHEDRVRQLILLNTVLYPMSTKLDRLSHTLFRIPLLNDLLMSRFGLTQILKQNTQTKGPALQKRLKTVLDHHGPCPKSVRIRSILAPIETGLENETPQLVSQLLALDVPKQLIVAQEDPLCYAHMQRFMKEHPKVPARVLEDCGHYLPLDRPEELTAMLRETVLMG